MKALLYAPEWYWKLTPHQRKEITNGCGPGRWGSLLVPDKLLGLCINEACRIHDAMYHDGETIEDKMEADRTFLNNMLRVIDAYHRNDRWYQLHRFALRKMRTRMAIKYYCAVRDIGGPAYWKDKNPAKNTAEVEV